MAFSIPFWVESRWNAREARDLSAQARLLAARIRAEERSRLGGFDHDPVMSRPDDDDEPELIFHVVRDLGDVVEVHVFLDERMLGELRHGEPWAWQGLIEFVEDDLRA